MIEAYTQVYIGGKEDCSIGDETMAIVHADKRCHARRLQYKGSLPPTHPHYLSVETLFDLWMNLIDPPYPLFKLESFKIFKAFATKHLEKRSLLIHCSTAQSRAPSLAMVYWKHLEGLEGREYDFVKQGFLEIYPDFDPGAGIEAFMIAHWEKL